MDRDVVMVAGGSGAMAYYFTEYVKQKFSARVWSLGRRPAAPWLSWYEPLDLDTCAINYLAQRIRAERPLKIFNFAGYANVRQSFDEPDEIIRNNITATVKLLEAVLRSGEDPVIVHASTSEIYGSVPLGDNPIKESAPATPISPYAVSKVAQEYVLTYFRQRGLNIVTTRAFGYINPRREDLVATAVARQVVNAELAGGGVVKYGNPHPVRTFCDVRDMAEAYWLASLLTGTFNIGSIEPITIGELVNLVAAHARTQIAVEHDPKLFRPADIAYCVPDCSAFTAATGWKPRRALDESLDWLLGQVRTEQIQTKGGIAYGW